MLLKTISLSKKIIIGAHFLKFATPGFLSVLCIFLVDNIHISLFSAAQCLNAVRTVQSLACLDEADHTVGFLLQLSNFCKEWQFHLPKLLHDIQARHMSGDTTTASLVQQVYSVLLLVSCLQVNLCYLCQTCTYLLHSKKMLHHYLQVRSFQWFQCH